MNKKNSIQKTHSSATILFLCFAVAVYSLSGLFSKLASGYEFLSVSYIASLSGVVFVLGLYAILWQIILKRVPLSQAYPFRSLGIVYGLVIAYFIFGEDVTIMNIIGSGMVLVGLLLMTIER